MDSRILGASLKNAIDLLSSDEETVYRCEYEEDMLEPGEAAKTKLDNRKRKVTSTGDHNEEPVDDYKELEDCKELEEEELICETQKATCGEQVDDDQSLTSSEEEGKD